MKHIMLDLETLGTKPGCCVLSIGAVAFDPFTGQLGEEFYRKLDWKGTSLKIETGTLAWWMEQSPEARKEAFSGTEQPFTAAMQFKLWYEQQGAENVWANDPTFDCAVWEAAVGIVPWNFRQPRSCRTIYDLAQIWPDRSVGTFHNALDDARNQAIAVCKCYAKLGVTSAPA